MRTAAVLPVKRFAQAKRRLGASVSAQLRERLAEAMVVDVLHALAHVPAIELTLVVTSERSLATEARAAGALLLEDEAEAGQSQAVAIGVRRALAEGFERVLCIPGDCPALAAGELELLLAQPPPAAAQAALGLGPAGAVREVVIVPDRHGSGTNGLLLTPPDAIAPSFGPDSCRRHVALARAAGAPWRLERIPSLLLDIDTGADLATLRARAVVTGQPPRPGHPPAQGPAARTCALLSAQAPGARALSLAGGR